MKLSFYRIKYNRQQEGMFYSTSFLALWEYWVQVIFWRIRIFLLGRTFKTDVPNNAFSFSHYVFYVTSFQFFYISKN